MVAFCIAVRLNVLPVFGKKQELFQYDGFGGDERYVFKYTGLGGKLGGGRENNIQKNEIVVRFFELFLKIPIPVDKNSNHTVKRSETNNGA
jgi:hypothetical protein